MKQIKTKVEPGGNYPLETNSVHDLEETIILRDMVLDTMAQYCAELSEYLFTAYIEQVYAKIKKLPPDKSLAIQMRFLCGEIKRRGIYAAGEYVIHELQGLLRKRQIV